MADQEGEAACLLIYTRPYPLQPWRARTPLLTNRQVREVLADPGKVRELGEPGTQLRVASFSKWPYDRHVHEFMSDGEFGRRGIPTVSFMSLIQMENERGQSRPPAHLRVASGDGVIA